MDVLGGLRTFSKLKSVYRFNTVDSRKESTAEHTWGCLVLADYFLSTTNYGLDRLKVYELLMYHDVVEIEATDTPVHDFFKSQSKEEREKTAAELLRVTLPPPINEKFYSMNNEFTVAKTMEAKFAHAIDKLEAEIHEMDYKQDWLGWTKEFLLAKKEKYFVAFPEIMGIFQQIVKYLEDNEFFNQKEKG